MKKNHEYFERAKRFLVGGVNSPVRAFRSVGGEPPIISHAKGARLYDVEGTEYIDFVSSWGAAILGHAREEIVDSVARAARDGLSFGASCDAEATLAELVLSAFRGADKARFTSSGTEAVMTAVRLTRGVTGREKLVKFSGCYHGHSDAVLLKGGSGAAQFSAYDGIPTGVARDTLVAEFNDTQGIERLFETHGHEIAAVILELVPCNMGVVLPDAGFLKEVERLCKKSGALLIADEVITGFRFGFFGVQKLYGITPDITTLGKIIGGGMPVGALVGRSEIMNCLAPEGRVYQAGTLSGNPLAMCAGIAQLSILKNDPSVYKTLSALSAYLNDGLKQAVKTSNKSVFLNAKESLHTLFFGASDASDFSSASKCSVAVENLSPESACSDVVKDFSSASKCSASAYAEYFGKMFGAGFYLPPSQFEACFLSAAHTKEDVNIYLQAVKRNLS